MLSRVVRVGRTLRSSGVLTRATRSLSVTAGGFPPLPTIDQAKAMPRHLSQVSGENLFVLTEQGNANAIREQLRREIMAVDGMEYEETTVRLREMSALVASNHAMYMAPFRALIGSAAICGFASLPLVFSFTCASWFNHHFVTADPPEVRAQCTRAHPRLRRARFYFTPASCGLRTCAARRDRHAAGGHAAARRGISRLLMRAHACSRLLTPSHAF